MKAGCMSMSEARMAVDPGLRTEDGTASDLTLAAAPTTVASIVPADSIAGRALVAVIAIMTFLAALTIGAVVLVRAAAGEWQSAVAREMTIQVRPIEPRNIEADVQRIVALASATPGVSGVRPY